MSTNRVRLPQRTVAAADQQEFDIRREGASTAREREATQYLLLGTGCLFGAVGIILLVSNIRSPPFSIGTAAVVVATIGASVGAFSAAARGIGANPDTIDVRQYTLAFVRKGKVVRRLQWSQPDFVLELCDYSSDPRANSLPRLALYSFRYSRGRPSCPISRECYSAIVDAATAHGLSIQCESAARYHFPGGEIVTLGPATDRGASPA